MNEVIYPLVAPPAPSPAPPVRQRREPVVVTDPESGITIQLPRTLTRGELRAMEKMGNGSGGAPTRRQRKAINKAGRSLDRRTGRA